MELSKQDVEDIKSLWDLPPHAIALRCKPRPNAHVVVRGSGEVSYGFGPKYRLGPSSIFTRILLSPLWLCDYAWYCVTGRRRDFQEKVKAEINRRFETFIERYDVVIHQAICDDFRYCHRRESKELESEGVAVAIAVADALISYQTQFPIPVTTVSVYLVKRHLLDKYCKCPQTAVTDGTGSPTDSATK